MDERSRQIGRLVRRWRTRRNLTRQQFADRVGRSTSWVDKVEAGERGLVRLPMLELVARALDIDPHVLVDDEAARLAEQCPDAAEVQAIKSALGRYDCAIQTPGRHADPPSLAQLRQRVDYASLAWLSSHFRTLGQVLPSLITDAQRAVEACTGEARLDATRQLVMTYRLASSTLLKLGCVDIAWLAADRAITAALATSDTLCLARASRSVARAMTSAGQQREAIVVLVGMANRMEPELSGNRPDLKSWYGMLLLAGQIAAARCGDADQALAMYQQAAQVATSLGPGYTEHLTAFGTANVALHRLAALVRLREGGKALEFAGTIDRSTLAALPRERKANYWLDLADAHWQSNDCANAATALLEAERVAAEEVRCRPVAHKLIRSLLPAATGRHATNLRQLAQRAGLPA